jgi:peptidoglycan/LPS O-acetylase OafA/YrhL
LFGILINHSICGTGAVIAFFVLSGFIIHYPYACGKKLEVKEFLVRRWVRVGGPLLVVCLIAYHYGVFLGIPIWSLICEVIYYALYPLLYAIKLSWRVKLYCSFILGAFATVNFNQHNIASMLHQAYIRYNPNYACNGPLITWAIGLPCWLLGVVLAERIDNERTVSVLQIFYWRVVIFVCGVIVFTLQAHYFVSYVLTLNFFAIVCYKWIGEEILYYRNHQPVEMIEYFGLFSYSLFISHKLYYYLFVHYCPINILSYPVYIFSAFFISYLFYLVVEEPSHKLARVLGKYKNY